MPVLKVKKFEGDAVLPAKANPKDAGYDLSSCVNVVIEPMKGVLVSTGLGITVPDGTYGRIAPRSGVSMKGVFVNAGVIDQTYTGEVKVLLFNFGTEPFEVRKGHRVAQLILERVAMDVDMIEVEQLETTQRGAAGFGSTGV